MRRTVLVILLVLLPFLASGAEWVRYEQLTIAGTAVGLTKATMLDPAGQPQSNFCYGVLQGAEVRYRYDGVDPTASVGTPLQVGDALAIDNHNDADKLRLIRTGATSGVLNVHCGVR